MRSAGEKERAEKPMDKQPALVAHTVIVGKAS